MAVFELRISPRFFDSAKSENHSESVYTGRNVIMRGIIYERIC